MELVLVALLVSVLVTSSGWAGAAEPEACGTCHPNVRVEYRGSVHTEHFGCTGCHGGDGAALTLDAHDAEKGYVGIPTRASIPALCASCHSDPARMRPFDLPTQQHAEYLTSEHGKAVAAGDTRAAVCSDCHGTHLILGGDEPTSPVFPSNVPATCGHCHGNADLMLAVGLSAGAPEEFRRSVHGYALLIEEHPSAPTCATCHGNHGVAPAAVASAPAACGHCHRRTREYFERGPHTKAVADGRMLECVTCHGDHAVESPSHALFGTTCPACHDEGTPGHQMSTRLASVIVQGDELISSAATDLEQAARRSPGLLRQQARMLQGRAHFVLALAEQHSLDAERVEDLMRTAQSIANEIRSLAHGVEQERSWRYVFLGIALIYILYAAALAYLYRRERRRN